MKKQKIFSIIFFLSILTLPLSAFAFDNITGQTPGGENPCNEAGVNWFFCGAQYTATASEIVNQVNINLDFGSNASTTTAWTLYVYKDNGSSDLNSDTLLGQSQTFTFPYQNQQAIVNFDFNGFFVNAGSVYDFILKPDTTIVSGSANFTYLTYSNNSYPALVALAGNTNNHSYRIIGGYYPMISTGQSQTQTTGIPSATDTNSYITGVETSGFPTQVTFFNQFGTSTVGTSTLVSATNFLSFLNVPQLIATRVPFAYIFSFYNLIETAISSSSATSLPTGTFNFQLPIGNSSTTVSADLFSTSTVSYFLTPTIIAFLRALMVAVVYLEMGWYLYHDARSKKHLF